MAIEILDKTSDGQQLYQSPEQIERHGANGDGWQLAITQDAVNHNLNDRGVVLFEALYRQVVAGDFKYPLAEFKSKFCPGL
jgi:hypothetical protein